ncbi:MAG: ABC transporter permease [Actinobacteria bacterium]|nr:ABC transporter permease [Actinomycetota bacterium]MBV8479992.1 ABC transporter permease [Actinomycetota bacterium]
MNAVVVHTRAQILELVRFPGFTIGTLAFPTIVFALFGLPRAGMHPEILLASYAAFGVLGVGFFQFGVSGAIERGTPWQAWVRTLPLRPIVRIAARVLAALVFTIASVAVVVTTALATTSASLSPLEWVRMLTALLLGSIPFVLLGLAIAYWASPKSALPVANILYMLLAYAGGLWTGPTDLPHAVATVSPYTPARQWGDVLWPAVTGSPWRASHWLLLGAYAIAFGAVAAWGLARDELLRFR